jgi:hypothetical protein
MAELGSHQKISRIYPGRPFGTGKDSAFSSATIPTYVRASLTTVANEETDITVSSSSFANDDIVLIHQSRGTNNGQWEINKVASGGGTTSLTLQTGLQYSYTDSGASQAQIIEVPQYTNVTVQSGTWTLPAWGGSTGGVFAMAATGTATITGTISANSRGYRGYGFTDIGNSVGRQGEGSGGDGGAYTSSANGTGGGGGAWPDPRPGGGGGNATHGSGSNYGAAGGNAYLTNMIIGGAGGGGSTGSDAHADGGTGGKSGGIIAIFANKIVVSGGITCNGGNGQNVTYSQSNDGGGGAGGSVLLACNLATLGTTNVTATKGSCPDNSGYDGSVGRIAVHYSGTLDSYTTSPTAIEQLDPGLVQSTGAFISLL